MTRLYLFTLAVAAGSVSLQPDEGVSEQVNELREVLSAAVTAATGADRPLREGVAASARTAAAGLDAARRAAG